MFHHLVLAGHETTSTLMIWTLYNLVNNPDVYRQCQAEVDLVLNNNDEITVSTVSLLTYTEAVLKETLRYHQPVPVLVRTATEDNTLVARDGKHIHIKKGTSVVINLHVLHRSEKYWHEPEKFDPLRFNERHSDILLPFGGGPRACIGQNFAMLETKIMLALLVRRFHFELVPAIDIDYDAATTNENEMRSSNQVNSEPAALSERQNNDAPPPYSPQSAGFCSQYGKARQDVTAKFCSSCGRAFN
ncbi:unnamed protein product [Rotaria sp. Silwood1]|nr:unnamed protein product [Rotaria sp. Silwood1]